MEKNRLSKILASAGVASRRAAEQMIFEGRVEVDGRIVLKPEEHVDFSQKIRVDGKKIKKPEEKKYFILNKPKGYICSAVRPPKGKIVRDLFPTIKERLFTVGRLDSDSEGLLLVTNDGSFANKAIHPKSNIEKEYHMTIDRPVEPEDIQKLFQPVYIEERRCKPKHVQKASKHKISITVKEGKKHEVRIMALKAGLKLTQLKRVRLGSLKLGKLETGCYRILSQSDQKQIFSKR